MDEQQYQAQVMDELKLKDWASEEIRKAYIAGWEKGMQDAQEIFTKCLTNTEKKNGNIV
jgi:hypothetical protein